VRGGDLHLRSSAGRLLGKLIVQRPALCLEIACVGISPREDHAGWVEDSRLETLNYPVAGVRAESGVGGRGAVDGITALLWLARDTGVARGQVAAASTASSDVLCQRMVAKCMEAIALTSHTDPALHQQLIAMGFKEAAAGQALRMAGGSLECAVTWLAEREETPGGPEDEFEMVEGRTSQTSAL
jgi:hypothetical protein